MVKTGFCREVSPEELPFEKRGDIAMLLIYPQLREWGVGTLDEEQLKSMASEMAKVYNIREQEMFLFLCFSQGMIQHGWGSGEIYTPK